ncbi:MAG TPA: hypothetical protein VK324_08520, partial [Tepidisphaeraceae bacterium]|nr:hypothetical protein [Tepidisphaeraceae bacterium]
MPSRPRAKPRAPEPLNAEPAYGFRAWRGTIGGPHATHTHADVEWNLLLGGAARYFIAGQFRPLPVGRLVVFWGAIPHRIVDWTAGATMLWVTLPIGWFLGWGLGDAIVTRMLGGGLIAEPDAARGPADE